MSSQSIPDQSLYNTTVTDGYAFFSGHTEPCHNHPAIYAFGSGSGETLVVTARGTSRSFPMRDFDAAIVHYKELLQKQGYRPGEAP